MYHLNRNSKHFPLHELLNIDLPVNLYDKFVPMALIMKIMDCIYSNALFYN